MKKLFAVISFAILSIAGLYAQVSLDTFIDRIYYGMTEDDLIRELGDAVQYYNPDDTTEHKVLGHELSILAHKLNLTSNFYTIVNTFSDYEVNVQIGKYVIPFTMSVDSLSWNVSTFVSAPDIDDEEEWDNIFSAILGNPDEFGNYYFSNCLLNINYSDTNVPNNQFIATIILTDHKMTTDEFRRNGIHQVQMQYEFFGIPMHTSYFTVKKMMNRAGYHTLYRDKDNLSYENILFAGLNWTYLFFNFNDERQFVDITFMKSFVSEKATYEQYHDLKVRLIEKYSPSNGFIPLEENNEWASREMSITLGSRYSTILCRLIACYSEDTYYLMLQYYDCTAVENMDNEL